MAEKGVNAVLEAILALNVVNERTECDCKKDRNAKTPLLQVFSHKDTANHKDTAVTLVYLMSRRGVGYQPPCRVVPTIDIEETFLQGRILQGNTGCRYRS